MTSLGFPVTSLILSYSPYEERQCESYVSLTQEHNTMNAVATPPPPPQQVTTLRREPLNLWYDLCPVIV